MPSVPPGPGASLGRASTRATATAVPAAREPPAAPSTTWPCAPVPGTMSVMRSSSASPSTACATPTPAAEGPGARPVSGQRQEGSSARVLLDIPAILWFTADVENVSQITSVPTISHATTTAAPIHVAGLAHVAIMPSVVCSTTARCAAVLLVTLGMLSPAATETGDGDWDTAMED